MYSYANVDSNDSGRQNKTTSVVNIAISKKIIFKRIMRNFHIKENWV
jgi:hypothetical protein